MKQRFAIPFVLLFLLTLTSFVPKSPTLIGKWKGEDAGEVGIITFDKAGYVSFMVDGEVVGGKNYTVEGIVMDMYYETDDTVTPHTIDFIFKLNEGQIEISRMLGIYHLVDDKTLILNMKFDGSERPANLNEDSVEQITLKKVKGS